MLVNSTMANEFLDSYKSVLAEVNGGKMPRGADGFRRIDNFCPCSFF